MADTKRKTFITFKEEDIYFKDEIVELLEKKNCIIDKHFHQDNWLDNQPEEEILKYIIEKHIKDSSVTIALITQNSIKNSWESSWDLKFKWMTREIAASLSKRGDNNTRNGLLLVFDNETYDDMHSVGQCQKDGTQSTTFSNFKMIKNIRRNIFNNDLVNECGNCWDYKNRYAVKVRWSEFTNKPKYYIEEALNKTNNTRLNDSVYVGGWKK